MKQLSLEDIIPGGKNYHNFQPDMPQQIKVYPSYFVLCFRNRIECRNHDNQKRCEFSLRSLSEYVDSSFATIPNLLFSPQGKAIMVEKNKAYLLDFSSYQITLWGEINKNAQNLTFHPDSLTLAYTIGNDIWVQRSNEKPELLYSEKQENVTIGKIPSREEFGISESLFWSPDGEKIAFYRINENNITSYPLVNIQDPIAKVEMIKYPMAGKTSEEVTLGIVQITSRECNVIDTKKEQTTDLKHHESYKSCISWSPDSRYLFLAEIERGQQKYELKYYCTHSGRLMDILYTEENPKYVEPQHGLYFIDEDHFIFQSRKSNFNHLYLTEISSGKIEQQTFGEWEVTELIGMIGNEIYFQSTYPTALERNIMAVKVGDSPSCRIIKESFGITSMVLHPQANYCILTHNDRENPGTIFIGNGYGREWKVIYQSENPYRNSYMPKQEIGSLLINEEKIYYRVTYPRNYNKKKDWPLVFYLYGGPHVQLIRNEWGSGTKGFEEMMALKGYVTFCIDPHGSDNRGADFESAIWRNIGKVQTEEYLTALNQLLEKEERINPAKIALYGWSFGGFMSIRLLLSYPDRFELGVAGGAVIDWKYYEVMYTERYMQRPIDNQEGYEKNALTNLVTTNIRDNQLFLIHCDNDPVVLWQHTLSFLKECNQKGVDVDYYVFPGHKHNVIGAERVHLMRKIANKIEQHLSPLR